MRRVQYLIYIVIPLLLGCKSNSSDQTSSLDEIKSNSDTLRLSDSSDMIISYVNGKIASIRNVYSNGDRSQEITFAPNGSLISMSIMNGGRWEKIGDIDERVYNLQKVRFDSIGNPMSVLLSIDFRTINYWNREKLDSLAE